MNDERYAPPLAPVIEPPPVHPLIRPTAVRNGVWLLWASYLLSLPAAIYGLFFPPERLSLYEHVMAWSAKMTIGFAITFALFASVGLGRNWARWMLLVLVALAGSAGIAAVMVLPPPSAIPRFTMARYAAQLGLQAVACVLLFTPGANAWYRAVKSEKSRAI
jgi:hypothetical protein